MEHPDFAPVNDRETQKNKKSSGNDLEKGSKIVNIDPVLLSKDHKTKLNTIIDEVKHLLESDPD